MVLVAEKIIEGEEDNKTYANDDHARGDRSRTVGAIGLTNNDIIYGREVGDDVVSSAEYDYMKSAKNRTGKGDQPLIQPKKRTDIQERAVRIRKEVLAYVHTNLKYFSSEHQMTHDLDQILAEGVKGGLFNVNLVSLTITLAMTYT